MPTITINFSNADGARIKVVQEYYGFTGTDAEHKALFKSKLIAFGKQFVAKGEHDISVDDIIFSNYVDLT